MRSQPLTDQPLPRYPIFPYTEWGSWRREVGEKSARNWTEFGEKLPKCRPTTAAIPYFSIYGMGFLAERSRREVGEKSPRHRPTLAALPYFSIYGMGFPAERSRPEIGQNSERSRPSANQRLLRYLMFPYTGWGSWRREVGEKSERSHPGTDQPLLRYPIFPYTEWGSRRREVGQRWDRIRREVAQVQTNDCCATLFFHIRDGVPGGEKSERSHPGTDQPLLSYPIFPYTE